MTKSKTNKKIQNLKNDFEEKVDLIHFIYDQLANGSRYSRPSKKINPDTKRILEKLFDIKSDETISTITTESGTLISAEEKEESSKNLGRTQIDLSLII